MALSSLANHLASKGRYGDSTLVHMNPREVQGLASLAARHGRRVTRNPDTGLPEAFDLFGLIPGALGTLVGITTGNPFLGAGAAGLASAGTTAAKGGSLTDALLSGLVTGAGSYALSGLTGAALGGAEAASMNAAQAGAAEAAQAAGTAIDPTSLATPGLSAGEAFAQQTPEALNSAYGLNPVAANQGLVVPASGPSATGLSALAQQPGAALSAAGQYAMDNPGKTLFGAATTLGGLGQYQAPPELPEEKKPNLRPGFGQSTELNMNTEGYNPFAAARGAPYDFGVQNIYSPPIVPGPTQFAGGGPIKMESGGAISEEGDSDVITSSVPQTLSVTAPPPLPPRTLDNWYQQSYPNQGQTIQSTAPQQFWNSLPEPFVSKYSPQFWEGLWNETSGKNSFYGDGVLSAAGAANPRPESWNSAKYGQWNWGFGDQNGGGNGGNGGDSDGGSNGGNSGDDDLGAYRVPGFDYSNYIWESMVGESNTGGESYKAGGYVPIKKMFDGGIASLGNNYSMQPPQLMASASSTSPTNQSMISGGSFQAPPVGLAGLSQFAPGMQPPMGMAAGGQAQSQRGMTERVVNEAAQALAGQSPNPQVAIQRFVEMFGERALVALQQRLQGQGGEVKGPGGGLDDFIPGSIDGKDSVRLASGEYVVSSDVVSGLGDGSTEEGVHKLNKMMDRVRMSKNGSARQPGKINDRKVMPA